MNSSVQILNPVAPARSDLPHARRHLDTLSGKVIGFIDNAKPNFNHLADDLAELLVSRYGVASVIRHRKRSATIPAPEEFMKDIAERCDAVITGSGD